MIWMGPFFQIQCFTFANATNSGISTAFVDACHCNGGDENGTPVDFLPKSSLKMWRWVVCSRSMIFVHSLNVSRLAYLIWVVVSNLFYVYPYLGRWSNFYNYFSDGLKPPTSWWWSESGIIFFLILMPYLPLKNRCSLFLNVTVPWVLFDGMNSLTRVWSSTRIRGPLGILLCLRF